jgi:hypothetical protein
MATVRIIRVIPDLSDSYKNAVQTLLNNPNHGVVIAGINLVTTMIRVEPKLARSWSQFSIPFTKILKTLNSTRPTREFCYGQFNDPYLQIKAMQALALLRKRSDELDGILQSIVSGTETRRNTGRAILYQAVETIVALCKKAALRGLAFNQVGRLLSMKDPSVLYSALSSFARVLYAERAIINRGSVDSMALQRYKTQIVQCLSHPDPSIRRRALDVISALIDEKNVETLIPEILVYVKLADAEFRTELVSKIYAAAQRFAPTPIWHFDTVHQILLDSGDYVPMEIISSFCDLIAKSAPLQAHAVPKLSESLVSAVDNQSLIQVAAFVIGEFAIADTTGALELFRQVLLLPQTKPETLLYIITAICKIAVRIGSPGDARDCLAELVKHNNLEVQQRAGEMLKLLTNYAAQCDEMLAPIQAATDVDHQASIRLNQNPTSEKTAENAAGDDLLTMMLDTKVPAPAPQATADLLNLLDVEPARPQSSTPLAQAVAPLAQAAAPVPQVARVARPAELVTTADFAICGQTQTNPANPRQVALRLLVYGVGHQPLSDFKLEFSATPGWQLKPPPMPPVVLQPGRQNPLSVVLYLMNSTNAPFQLQVRASYRFGAQPLTETVAITRLP